jgi:phospholipid/cholesterol/gamma-HCH transport system substrate-binding protein
MRNRQRDLVRVGLFVAVAGTLLVGGLLWIAGSRLLRPVDTYTVLFADSVTGLNAGANVEYQGVVVGRVRDIQLTRDIPPKVAVIVDIEPGTQIREDTVAALLGSIVTGIKYIQLQGGTPAAAPLPPGGTIRGDVTSLEVFRDKLTQVADRAVSILRRLDEDVFTPENTTKLSTFMSDLSSVTASVNQALENLHEQETSRNLGKLVRQVSDVAGKLDLVLSDFYGRRERVYGGLESVLARFDQVATELRDLLKTTSGRLGDSGDLGRLIGDLSNATTRLQETIDVIRSDPSLLLRGRKIPEREFAR